MKNKIFMTLLIALVIAVFNIANCLAQKDNLKLSGKVVDGVRVIEIKAMKFKFEPDPIVANLGDKVRLVATSADVTHGIAIAQFKVNLAIKPGKTSTVEFNADKKGTFKAYCSIFCGHGHAKMQVDFIVK